MRKQFVALCVVVLLGLAGALMISTTPDTARAMGPSLRSVDTTESEVKGTFTLILFGARHADDIETVAFLDREDDRYTFEIFAPDFDFRVVKTVTADKALAEASRFVSWHPMFVRSVVSRVVDDKGTVLGFEVRPLYRPFRYGMSDVMDISYFPRGDTVRVHIKLKPQIERQQSSGDSAKGGKSD